MPDISKVLLLGDSIRMSYQPHVVRMLDGEADVVGPADNCQYSLFTLSSIDRWVGELGIPQVVHWNSGIHDAGHNPRRSPVQIPLEMYRANLQFILEKLRLFTSRIIFATSTPVHPDRPFLEAEWSWRNGEIDKYNDAARTLMESEGVPINDLGEVVWKNYGAFLSEDQLHLSTAGQLACAHAVADRIRPALA